MPCNLSNKSLNGTYLNLTMDDKDGGYSNMPHRGYAQWKLKSINLILWMGHM
jgi:hypothetical protein